MKFWKWFAIIDEGSSEGRIRAEYATLPDRQLAAIDPGTLTALGLKCYREEVARRHLPDQVIHPPAALKGVA